jgi:hypothetical protein
MVCSSYWGGGVNAGLPADISVQGCLDYGILIFVRKTVDDRARTEIDF